MKIQFLEIETEQSWAVTSIAPGYLGSFIKLDGHAAFLSRIGPTQNADEIIDQIKETAPEPLAGYMAAENISEDGQWTMF